jgi:DNA-binding NtrC family response regulator
MQRSPARVDTCVLNGSDVSWRSPTWDERWNGGRPTRSKFDLINGVAAATFLSAREVAELLREATETETLMREVPCKGRSTERQCAFTFQRFSDGVIISAIDTTNEWAERRQRLALTQASFAMVQLPPGDKRVRRMLEVLATHFEATVSTAWGLDVASSTLVLRHVVLGGEPGPAGVAVASPISGGASLARSAWFGRSFVMSAVLPDEDARLVADLRPDEALSGWAIPYGGRGPDSGAFVFYCRASTLPSPSAVERLLTLLQPPGAAPLTTRPVESSQAFDQAVRSDSTVLLLGETGSGKTHLARKIHDASGRAQRPFIELNCAGLNAELVESELFGHERGSFTGAAQRKPGLLEVAEGGTVFLDEVGELGLLVQAKLLKVLETRRVRRVGGNAEVPVDFRLMCATHRDLREEVSASRFRSDLFFRIQVLVLNVAPLRARPWELPGLASELLLQLREVTRTANLRLADDALPALLGYPWPGNVRELRNTLERAALLAPDGLVGSAQVLAALESGAPPRLSAPAPAPRPSVGAVASASPPPLVALPPPGAPLQSLRASERALIVETFERTGRNLSESARLLCLPRTTLRSRLRRFGVL